MSILPNKTETYARDSHAEPLRSLAKVLEKIRAKTFDPDSTRSGLLKATTGNDDKVVVEESGSSTCPSAISSASSTCSEDETLAVPEDESGALIFNTATMCMHISAGQGRLRCGRRMPEAYGNYSELPEGTRVCPMCF